MWLTKNCRTEPEKCYPAMMEIVYFCISHTVSVIFSLPMLLAWTGKRDQIFQCLQLKLIRSVLSVSVCVCLPVFVFCGIVY